MKRHPLLRSILTAAAVSGIVLGALAASFRSLADAPPHPNPIWQWFGTPPGTPMPTVGPKDQAQIVAVQTRVDKRLSLSRRKQIYAQIMSARQDGYLHPFIPGNQAGSAAIGIGRLCGMQHITGDEACAIACEGQKNHWPHVGP